MHLQLYYGTQVVFETETDCVPRPGDRVVFVMDSLAAGIKAGTKVAGFISAGPAEYDFIDDASVEVSLYLQQITPMQTNPLD